MKTMLSLLVASVVLSGCAAMSESECKLGDWYGAGLRDGQQGEASQIAEYAKACSEYGVTAGLVSYQRGHEQGLLSYCTPENGYRVGRAGGNYGNVCAPHLQAGFLREYQRGYDFYRIERDIREQESRLERLHKERKTLEEQLIKADKEDERRKLLRQLNRVGDEQEDTYRQIKRLRSQLDR
ncbi:DUF2799 domain-containing protein [Chitinibacter sp. SCUT-21]|uniref:DUF2799 domain-containing protein n=1 Tax=Chitinibacter sp. SCUT-21 TaxID=2970891 RepID=UPI0035A58047